MNTPTRRSIFYIIMSSSDYIDCSNKLTRMNLRGKEPREIVRVLATCCGSEGKYNEYYSHLAGRIIEEDEGAKFTFQLTFWDMFKQFGEMELRKASNLARLLSSLVIGRGVGMNVLKVVAFEEIEEEASAVFFTVFFKSLFDEVGELEVEALFSDLREDLREGVRLFFDRYLKNCDSNKKGGKGNGNGGRGNKDWRRKFKKAVKILGKHRERGADELSVGDGGVARGDEDEEENGGRAYNDDDWD
ncbi:hypothetical protein ScalyP_jg10502 [Parmales sp. scaly parma]|nr:hypothetical protein ScalyP_jg10502 [Parmales sp. scaly parma]